MVRLAGAGEMQWGHLMPGGAHWREEAAWKLARNFDTFL